MRAVFRGVCYVGLMLGLYAQGPWLLRSRLELILVMSHLLTCVASLTFTLLFKVDACCAEWLLGCILPRVLSARALSVDYLLPYPLPLTENSAIQFPGLFLLSKDLFVVCQNCYAYESKKKCFSNALGYTLVVLEML